jgi:RNA polymerase sigma-70 factor, ECF subfamily
MDVARTIQGSARCGAHGTGERVDAGLVVRAQAGDRDAFERIVDVSFDRSHAAALRLLRDSQLADDAVQQAMINIWRDLPRLRDPSRYDAWSYKLLVRACYAEFRRAPHWMPAISEGSPTEPRSGDPYGAVVDRDQLERGFRRLSMDHRVVIVLHHYLDLPLDEVGRILGIPVGTVKSRMHRALAEMRAALEADTRPSGSVRTPVGPVSGREEVAR